MTKKDQQELNERRKLDVEIGQRMTKLEGRLDLLEIQKRTELGHGILDLSAFRTDYKEEDVKDLGFQLLDLSYRQLMLLRDALRHLGDLEVKREFLNKNLGKTD